MSRVSRFTCVRLKHFLPGYQANIGDRTHDDDCMSGMCYEMQHVYDMMGMSALESTVVRATLACMDGYDMRNMHMPIGNCL